MRNFIIFLLILGAIGWLVQSHHSDADQNQDPDPGQASPSGDIVNPVYAEVRFTLAVQDRSFTMVALGKAFDQADCKRITDDLVDRMQAHLGPDGRPFWAFQSSDCESQLDERSARLFDNKPTFVPYVSASPGPGAPQERETRMLIWGVTAQEGGLVCSEVPRLKQKWQGRVTCIPALPSQ